MCVGVSYFTERQETAYYQNEDIPQLDDMVKSLVSSFSAVLNGDEIRFHLETLHRSEDEIRRLRRLGKKVEKVVYAVQNEQQPKHDSSRELYYAMLLLEDLAEYIMEQNYNGYESNNDYEDIEYDQCHGFDMTMGGM